MGNYTPRFYVNDALNRVESIFMQVSIMQVAEACGAPAAPTCDTATAGDLNTGVCPNGDTCPNGAGDCASNYCDASGVCADLPAPTCDTATAGDLNTGVCPNGDTCPNGAADCASNYCDASGVCADPVATCDTATAGDLNTGVCPNGDTCPNGAADCASGYCDASGVCADMPAPACDLTDPAADCDMDGNPNGTDPNPEDPTAVDDGVFPM